MRIFFVYIIQKYKTTKLLIFAITTFALLWTTNSAFGTHMIDRTVSADISDRFTINAEPVDESTILVTGHAPRTAMEPVEITVTAPNGNLVGVDQLVVDSDFNYMTKIKTNSKLWNVNGAYVITAYQGPSMLNNFVSTNVQVVNGLIANFNLNYQIDGGFVNYIESESNSNSLIISIDTEIFGEAKREGVLKIELPRTVIDAKIRDSTVDGPFVILVDGVDTAYEEAIASSVRTLTIPFPYGSEEIKITGSYEDPEFGVSSFSESSLNPTTSEQTSESVSQDAKVMEASVTSFLTIFVVIAAITAVAVIISVYKRIP